MKRALLLTSLLAGVLAFGAMPAQAGVYGEVNINVGHPAPVVCDDAQCGPTRVAWNRDRWYGTRGEFRGQQFRGREFQGREFRGAPRGGVYGGGLRERTGHGGFGGHGQAQGQGQRHGQWNDRNDRDHN